MLGDVARGVGFYEQVEVATVVIGGDGRVGADDFFARDRGGERDVLADGETKSVCGTWEGEAVAVLL
jgi:hypothetical protein